MFKQAAIVHNRWEVTNGFLIGRLQVGVSRNWSSYGVEIFVWLQYQFPAGLSTLRPGLQIIRLVSFLPAKEESTQGLYTAEGAFLICGLLLCQNRSIFRGLTLYQETVVISLKYIVTTAGMSYNDKSSRFPLSPAQPATGGLSMAVLAGHLKICHRSIPYGVQIRRNIISIVVKSVMEIHAAPACIPQNQNRAEWFCSFV